MMDHRRIILKCHRLTKSYVSDSMAVDDMTIEVSEGEILALVGPSGCGKTTLLRLVAGLETPDAGTVEVGGKIMNDAGVFVPSERRGVGFVFQDYALFPHMTVARNVRYGLSKSQAQGDRIHRMLELVGLSVYHNRYPHELSGGERQRVALARALAPAPQILLMDEPFSNLDPALRGRVRREVKDILRAAGATVVFVTHDQEEALFMGDTIAVMDRGRLEQEGTPEEVFHSPVNRFVASFMGDADFLPAWIQGERVVTEIGLADVGAWTENVQSEQIEVMVRPDDLKLALSEEGIGTITERTFTGPFYLYQVRLNSGQVCRVLSSHTSGLEIGARVSVGFTGDHPLSAFRS